MMLTLTGCKSEQVKFGQAQSALLQPPQAAGGDEEPQPLPTPQQPEPEPEPQPEPQPSPWVAQVDNVTVEPDDNAADILFVVDNSGSMEEEQLEMARRSSRFFSKVRQLDWRVGMITTDPYLVDPAKPSSAPNNYSDGQLLQFPNQSYWLDAGMTQEEAWEQFSLTVRRDESGNGHERGIRNVYRSIQRSQNPSASGINLLLSQFFRPQASLSIVLISDEDETLVDGAGNPLSDLQMSQGAELVRYVEQTWGADKEFQFNSIIVRPGDAACISQFERYGEIYSELSQLTGGVVEDICANDYSGALDNIGSGVVNLQTSYDLQCVPQDIDGDGKADMEFRKQNQVTSLPGYSLVGPKIEFVEPLAAGDYEFHYHCLRQR